VIRELTKNASNFLRRKSAYRRVFLHQDGGMSRDQELVLADLRRFCKANSSTIMVSPVSRSVDPIAMAMAEGRREVWLRLAGMLHIDEKTMFNLQDVNDGN
jgi:dihydroorotase-like cyclic amidohydrolase